MPTTHKLPGISCICVTYARPHLLEEAIHSFLLQDYAGAKELIVLNDYTPQILEFEHPEVEIINLPYRFRTVGEKMNAAVSMARYDLICLWDDDDIVLPHRLALAGQRVTTQLFRSNFAWKWDGGELSGPMRSAFHAARSPRRSRRFVAASSGARVSVTCNLGASRPGSCGLACVAPRGR